MPYDFTFRRVTFVDNQIALEKNISLGLDLIHSFPEIKDFNLPDSGSYFTKTVLDASKEFPELHFYLVADIDGFFYHFSFWKDYLYVELGAGGDIVKRFEYLLQYAEVILKHNFLIEDPLGETNLSSDVALERHITAYKKWISFVDTVRNLHERSN
ncbi:hypothetical protein ACFS6H_18080 [Terrimonas rubra]|uniref:Uncharacterized protein n=1 Tax=Terrimonas rubra TaxID=1035890 RepID=A0ABW6ABS1_9BACT